MSSTEIPANFKSMRYNISECLSSINSTARWANFRLYLLFRHAKTPKSRSCIIEVVRLKRNSMCIWFSVGKFSIVPCAEALSINSNTFLPGVLLIRASIDYTIGWISFCSSNPSPIIVLKIQNFFLHPFETLWPTSPVDEKSKETFTPINVCAHQESCSVLLTLQPGRKPGPIVDFGAALLQRPNPSALKISARLYRAASCQNRGSAARAPSSSASPCSSWDL